MIASRIIHGITHLFLDGIEVRSSEPLDPRKRVDGWVRMGGSGRVGQVSLKGASQHLLRQKQTLSEIQPSDGLRPIVLTPPTSGHQGPNPKRFENKLTPLCHRPCNTPPQQVFSRTRGLFVVMFFVRS
jgi:hypothetical protein